MTDTCWYRLFCGATLLASTAVLAGCGAEEVPPEGASGGPPESAAQTPAIDPPPSATQVAHGPDVEAEVAARVAALATPVTGSLMQTLSGNLMAAVERDGAVGAVSFCNLEARALRQQVEEETGFEMKRTSWRVRNPQNAPDALEQRALDYYAATAEAGEPPQPWVQSDGEGGYRFYRPLPTASLCLNCHGGPDDLAEGIPAVLAELYPNDLAVGFSEGELRGLLRVSVPSSAVTEGG